MCLRHCLTTLSLVFLVTSRLDSPATAADADIDGIEFFEKRIRPVLVQHCFECHATKPKKSKGGLRLDSKRAALAGGDSGPVIMPGKPDESLLIDAVAYGGEFVDMPPSGKLPDRVIADFRTWIALGAPMPDDKTSDGTQPASSPAPQKTVDIEAGRSFWSFQPVSQQPLPNVSNADWPQQRLDWFVLAKLDEQQLEPNPPADRRTLLRRLDLDLTGLPPTPDDVDAFVSDASPDAIERVVDRLLCSPHYGERWGRHWLDVARYAEDNPTGESTCQPPPFPWPYRDWVIRTHNDDLPYDEFVRRQLAADLMDLPPEEIAATGFLGLSPVYHKEPKLSGEVIRVIVADEWDERLDTISRGFLGLTVACARCHDHKFDPITTRDYYALAGVMASTQLVEWPLVNASLADAEALTKTREAIVDYNLRVSYAKAMQTAAEIEKQPTEPFEKLAKEYQKTLDDWKSRKLFDGPIANVVRDAGVWVDDHDPDWTNMVYRAGEPRNLPVFVRGNPNNPGDTVPRRFLEVLSDSPARPFKHGSGRLELADAIVTDAAPLAARVIVNRVWGWHFGQPLVRTPGNFGALGERPSHPELLDDLAARFIASGWSLKWLHREIVLSTTWQQSSRIRDGRPTEVDPDNRLLWRMNRRRLEAEVWRDAVLATIGQLDGHMFGKSDSIDDEKNHRRTIYGTITRQNPADVLRLFDFPDAKRHSDQRTLTTSPLQQLYLLNGPFLQQAADHVVNGPLPGSTDDSDARSDSVQQLFRTILLREPTTDELDASLRLIGDESTQQGWQILAHSLLATNEFLYSD
ncbi:DUF1549 domain-containing protein [bacterium]|nr:DUF1549 domain-containing protein [bacterium]